MQQLDLNMLTLIIGLSVYVSSIRFVILGRLLSDPEPKEPQKASYKAFLRLLILPDAAFIIAGIAVFLLLFWDRLFGGVAPAFLNTVAIWTFFIGGLWLVGLHVMSCIKTWNA